MIDIITSIERLSSAQNIISYKDVQLELKKDEHPLFDLLPLKCTTPYILAYKSLASTKSTPLIPAQKPSTPRKTKASGSNSEEATVDFSFDGSPLKLEVFNSTSVDLSDSLVCNVAPTQLPLEKYCPLTCTDARQLQSELTCAITSYGSKPPVHPLWMLCDAKDPESTVAVAAYIKAEENEHFSIKLTKIVSKGDIKKSCNLPKFKNIKDEHIHRHGSKLLSMESCATYSIVGGQDLQTSFVGDLHLTANWSEESHLLQTPPLSAVVDVTVGAVKALALSLSDEISVLQLLVRGMKTRELQWTDVHHDMPLIDRVRQLLNDLKQVSLGQVSEDAAKEEVPETPSLLFFLSECKDHDFTDKLWMILKDCNSFNDLVSCFEEVFTYLQVEELQPMVRRNNQCKIARCVHAASIGKLECPSLEGIAPLQMLVEMGLEKLERDLTTTLIAKELVTVNQLECFRQHSGDVSERLVLVEKLHTVIGLMVCLQQYLNLPLLALSTATRRALKHFETHSVNDDTLSLRVNTMSVANKLHNAVASQWKTILQSELHGHDVDTVCMLTEKPIFPQTQSDISDDLNAMEAQEEIHYYFTEVTEHLVVL